MHQNADDPSKLPDKNIDPIELVGIKIRSYEDSRKDHSPLTGNQPLFIGGIPGDQSIRPNFLDGFVDEIRISDVARPVKTQPFIEKVTQYHNRPPAQSYPVEATVRNIMTNKVDSVTLHYRIDSTRWQVKHMAQTAEGTYIADIPSQPADSYIEYFVIAANESGKQSYTPDWYTDEPIAYSFTTWEQRAPILDLSFDQAADGELPTNTAYYNLSLSAEGDPRYASGDEGSDDRALVFDASRNFSLEAKKGYPYLNSFLIDLKLYVSDSIFLKPVT